MFFETLMHATRVAMAVPSTFRMTRTDATSTGATGVFGNAVAALDVTEQQGRLNEHSHALIIAGPSLEILQRHVDSPRVRAAYAKYLSTVVVGALPRDLHDALEESRPEVPD